MSKPTIDPKKVITAGIAMDGNFLTEGLVKRGGLISTSPAAIKPAAPPAQKPQQTGTQNTQQTSAKSDTTSNNEK